MIIKFKLGKYDYICDKYEMLFQEVEPKETEEQNGDSLVLKDIRVVIPQLHISFREADWYTRNEDVEDPNADDAWEVQASVFVLYEEEEKDINKYISFTTGYLEPFIAEACEKAGYPYEKRNKLDCYIDTSDFVDEETVKKLFPKNWKKPVIAKYPEFFEAIKGHSYKMNKIPYYDARVEVFNERSYLSVYLGETYWYNYCNWFGHNTSFDSNQDAAYHEIINFVKSIINNEKFGVVCFDGDRRKGTALYNVAELSSWTREKVLEDFQKSYPDLAEKGHRVEFHWCFWEGPENYKETFYT